ncbi:MAG: CDP-alcohol phosphatidyltransferase family protein [Oscillospiraceae bacterium]|nr:CDP-alcohol phosphatidyltransferase family protein [Oscillospiraceae bacterium]
MKKQKKTIHAGAAIHNLGDRLKTYHKEMTSAQKCENINDPVDAHFFDALANVWTRLFIKLGIVPNAVTILSMISGVAGGVLIAFHTLPLTIVGVVLVLMSAIFDCSDGQVARRTRHFSKIGRLLDGFSDATVYFTVTAATAIRAAQHCPIDNRTLWSVGVGVVAFVIYLMYIRQCQLADYFKNVYMYMIDNTRGNELSRAKTIRAQRDAAPKGSFDRFSLTCYAMYTKTQERRAKQTQQMLDKVERLGKTDLISNTYHKRALRLVQLTNLMTFNLRTAVLILLLFLHWEVWLFAFVVVVLEPIRRILLWKFEQLARELQEDRYYALKAKKR